MSFFPGVEPTPIPPVIPDFRTEPWSGDFSLPYYLGLVETLGSSGRELTTFSEFASPGFTQTAPLALLRHDIDISLDAAVELARQEAERGTVATYFALVDADVYKVADSATVDALRTIQHEYGHEVGLHYAPQAKPFDTDAEFEQDVISQANQLEAALGADITSVSFHKPSHHPNSWLGGPLRVAGLINAYAGVFISPALGALYATDSRGVWSFGEPVERIRKANKAAAPIAHLLTHAEWWDLTSTEISQPK